MTDLMNFPRQWHGTSPRWQKALQVEAWSEKIRTYQVGYMGNMWETYGKYWLIHQSINQKLSSKIFRNVSWRYWGYWHAKVTELASFAVDRMVEPCLGGVRQFALECIFSFIQINEMKQPRLGDAPFARSFKHEQAGLFGHAHPHFAFSSRILTMSAVLIKLHQVKSTSVPSRLTLKPKMFEQNQNPKLNPKKRTHMCCPCFFPCFFPMYPMERVPLFFQVARSEGAGAAPIKIS